MVESFGLFEYFVIFSALSSILLMVRYWRNCDGLKYVSELDLPFSFEYPKLTIIIPSRNEQESLKISLSRLLDNEYPNMEIIVVNDRSTDGSYEVITSFCERDSRVRAIFVDSISEGWLGKVHAIKAATEIATGDYLLYSDADVIFEKTSLRRILYYVFQNKIEFLSLFPKMLASSVIHRAMVASFYQGLALLINFSRIGSRNSNQFFAMGAFILVERSTYLRSQGLDWIKMDVADDLAFAKMIHMTGCKKKFLLGDLISVEWYKSAAQMCRGLEKNIFGFVTGYSYVTLWGCVVPLFVGELVAFIALAYSLTTDLWPLTGLVIVAKLVISFCFLRRLGVSFTANYLSYLGSFITFINLMRSSFMFWLRGGIIWRGDFYDAEKLKKNQRVKLADFFN